MLVVATGVVFLIIYLDIIMPTLFLLCPSYRRHIKKIINKFLT